MNPHPSSFALLTSPGAKRLAAEGTHRPIVLLPVGAIEQHGPHLPLGVDAWLAERVALVIAEGDLAARVTEPLAYGSSEHHRSFAGTMSLGPQTFISVLVDLCGCLAADGFLPVIVNGHGGNRAAIQVAITTLGRQDIVVAGFSYFDLIVDEASRILPDAAEGTGHACALETSLMIHLFADTVRRSLIPQGATPSNWPDPHLFSGSPVTVWRRFETINPTGVIGTPSQASAEAGAKLFEAAIRAGRETVMQIRNNYAVRKTP